MVVVTYGLSWYEKIGTGIEIEEAHGTRERGDREGERMIWKDFIAFTRAGKGLVEL